MSLETIALQYEKPLIVVVGANSPSEKYDPDDGYRLGYELREFVEQGGSLFTGGVSGVGVDVFRGIVEYAREKGVYHKFFLVFPDDNSPFDPAYSDLAGTTKDKSLPVERLGKDFDERRSYIATLADVLVVVNGSAGTVDEGMKGLLLQKPVVCLEHSGGAAEAFCRLKRGEIDIPLSINKELIYPCDSITDIIRYMNKNIHRKNGHD